jgi:hypothetical protein
MAWIPINYGREMLKILLSSSPYHPLFLKKFDFYYKRVIRGDEGRMCRALIMDIQKLNNIALEVFWGIHISI